MIKSQILNMIFHRKPAIQIVLPKYDHDIHHEYGIGPMLGWESLNCIQEMMKKLLIKTGIIKKRETY